MFLSATALSECPLSELSYLFFAPSGTFTVPHITEQLLQSRGALEEAPHPIGLAFGVKLQNQGG